MHISPLPTDISLVQITAHRVLPPIRPVQGLCITVNININRLGRIFEQTLDIPAVLRRLAGGDVKGYAEDLTAPALTGALLCPVHHPLLLVESDPNAPRPHLPAER